MAIRSLADSFSGPVFTATGLMARLGTNIYVCNSACVSKITAPGVVSLIAGDPITQGYLDGTGAAARFGDINLSGGEGGEAINGIAVGPDGTVYVADTNCIVRKISPCGVVTSLCGQLQTPINQNGTGVNAHFDFANVTFGGRYFHISMVVGVDGFLYVATGSGEGTPCFINHIRKINTTTGVVTTLAGQFNTYTTTDGTGAGASFCAIWSMIQANDGNLYVSEYNYNTSIQYFRRVTMGGVVTTLPTTGIIMPPTSLFGYNSGDNLFYLTTGIDGLYSAGEILTLDPANSNLISMLLPGPVHIFPPPYDSYFLEPNDIIGGTTPGDYWVSDLLAAVATTTTNIVGSNPDLCVNGRLIIGNTLSPVVYQDISGLYILSPGLTHDKYLDRNPGIISVNLKIPDPFTKEGYIGG